MLHILRVTHKTWHEIGKRLPSESLFFYYVTAILKEKRLVEIEF